MNRPINARKGVAKYIITIVTHCIKTAKEKKVTFVNE